MFALRVAKIWSSCLLAASSAASNWATVVAFVQATAKVWDLGFGLPLAPVLLGVVTAIGGGLIRDVLAGRQNLLMKRELYAIPVLLGCSAFALVLKYLPQHHFAGELICGLGIFAFRSAAIHWNLSVPDWLATKTKAQS